MSWPAAAVAALGFLTRIPVGGRPLSPADLSRAAVFFPAVGAVVAAVAAGTHWLAGLALPAGPSTVLALAAAIIVTGAFHEDGLADTADGLGAHVGRERKLEIMRDSRVGTYGALAIALPLLLAYAVLSEFDTGEFARAMLAAHVLGRWSTLPQSRFVAPARAAGAGAAVRVSTGVLAVGSVYAFALVLVAAGPQAAAIAIAIAAALGAACAAGLRRTLGGVTGDTFGAVNVLTQSATLLVLAGAWTG
jgi:adenosylcobinamide-GDP ribazoletransferase